jgi:allantoicase
MTRVIILLATPLTHLSHVDIDTSHFSGNECPESQIFALQLDQTPAANGLVDGKSAKKAYPLKLSPNDPRWQEILPVVALGPNSRHIFKLGQKANNGTWSAVMVRMIPDGGMVSTLLRNFD